MSRAAKTIIVFIFLLSLGVMFLAFMLVQKMEGEKKRRVFVEGELQKTEVKLSQTEQEKDQISKQLNEMVAVKEQIKVERDKAKEEAQRLSTELEKEKREKKQLEQKLEEKQKTALDLMKQLQDEKAEKEKLGKQLTTLQQQTASGSSNSADLLAKLQKAQEEKDMLTRKLREMSSTPEAPVKIRDIIVQADQKFSGTVLTVNREFNFVVVDIGEVDGLVKGTELIVHRGKKLIGKIRVEKVYDKMSAATIIPKWTQDEIKEDDSVKKF